MTLHRNATRFAVYINGDLKPQYEVLKIMQSAGGRSLDSAEIFLDLSRTGTRLQNRDLAGATNQILEIAQIFPSGQVVAVHYGCITGTKTAMDGQGEQVMFTSKFEPWMFGSKIRGMLEAVPALGAGDVETATSAASIAILGLIAGSTGSSVGLANLAANIAGLVNVAVANAELEAAIAAQQAAGITLNHEDLLFNPRIDEKIEPNCSENPIEIEGITSFHLFLDPESARSQESRAVHGDQTPELWTMPRAIQYLCHTLNPYETHIKNPTDAELEAIFQWESKDALRNVSIPIGLTLPEALDRLLEPLSYTWFIEYVSRTVRKIRIAHRGFGAQRQVFLQPIGQNLDALLSNCPQFSLEYNLTPTVNALTVYGDSIYVEATFELYKCWGTSNDSMENQDLAKDAEAYLDSSGEERRVWRDWVLNEAGDYNGIRPEIEEAYNLKEIFGHDMVPKRRQFLPTLTVATDVQSGGERDRAPIGEVQGCHVEFSLDAGDTWEDIRTLDDCSCKLLARECGVRFDGHLPPEIIQSAGEDARVRITATIRSDLRLSYTAWRRADSVLKFENEEVLDLGSRFQFRAIHSSSVFFEQVQNEALESEQRNDAPDLELYTTNLLESWDMAEVSGNLAIEGMDHGEYRVCDVITGVYGRDIGFPAKSSQVSTDRKRYPQITGITYDVQGQRRILAVETFYDRPT